jgi:hypothetical protein
MNPLNKQTDERERENETYQIRFMEDYKSNKQHEHLAWPCSCLFLPLLKTKTGTPKHDVFFFLSVG